MPEIASSSAIAEKWARVTPQRAADYVEGINNPRRDWADATADAEDSYNTGVQAAIGRGAFAKGVRAAGTSKWKQRTQEKGPARWGQGVQFAKNDYQQGFEPYRQVIANTTLPPRGAKGSPENIQRVAVLAQALHEEKLSQGG